MIKIFKNKTYKFLRWTEKWTKTDMVYLSYGSFWSMMGSSTSMLSAFLISLAFANLVPTEIYGSYNYILSIYNLLAISTLSGMQTAINRAAAKGHDAMLDVCMKTSIRWGFLGGLLSLFLSLYNHYKGDVNLTYSFLVIAVFIPFMDPLNSYVSFLQGKQQFKLVSKYSIVRDVFITISTVVTLLLTKNIIVVIFMYFITRTIIRFILLKLTIKKVRPNQEVDSTIVKFGWHFSFMGIFEICASQLDSILIWHFLGPTSIAIYSFAQLPINQLKGLSKNFSSLAFPKLAGSSVEYIKNSLNPKIKKSFLIVIFIAALYYFSSPFVFKILFPKYLESIKLTKILSVTILLIPFSLYNTTLVAHGRYRELYSLSVSYNVIKLILYFLLLPLYGLMGMVVSIVIMEILINLITFFLYRRLK